MTEGADPPVSVEESPPADSGVSVPWHRRRIRAEHVRDYGILVVFASLFVALSVGSSGFLTTNNLLNILYENAPLGILACGVTLVIVAGNFDLSLGAMFALTEVCATEAAIHWGAGFGLVVPLLAGAVLGLINGLLVTKLRINAFLATLATSLAFGGAATAISGGLLLQVTSSTFLALGRDSIGQVQYSVIVFVVLAVLLQFVLGRTVFGRYCYGVGGNREAARQSGLRVDRIAITTFMIAGVTAGIAGLIDASTTGSGSSTAGANYALTAIAAVALGGTSIFGGAGSVWRTVVGVLLLALITNGFDLLGVAAFYQDIVKGALIVLAVSVGSLVERR
ncbi:MAG: ABC transporter permease [Solirubrobacterales bacterium]|nr:ABC transporter permease [Solirubrobacterales bacterium]MBV9472548.1 ABC transporter permease [Solirubrobacterales bacterium]